MFKRTALCAVIVACGVALGGGPLAAQQGGIKRTFLQRFDVPGSNYETIVGIAEIAPNAVFARHTHPGPEAAYMLQGTLTLQVQGRPPLMLKAGQSYQLPAATVHSGKAGPEGAKLLSTWVVEKGKPLASPAK